MPGIAKMKNGFLLLVVALSLIPGTGAGLEDGERQKLLEQEKLLREHIAALRKEQDFLLFEKVLYASDSKYLIIHLSGKKGELRYKNKVLKDFRFSSMRTGKMRQGMAALTKKIEGAKGPKGIVFENDLVLVPKNSPSAGAAAPCLLLGKKDFNAIFYALEEGGRTYLLP